MGVKGGEESSYLNYYGGEKGSVGTKHLNVLMVDASSKLSTKRILWILNNFGAMKEVSLTGTQVTKEILELLAQKGGYELIDFYECPNVTADDFERLQEALPNCSVYW